MLAVTSKQLISLDQKVSTKTVLIMSVVIRNIKTKLLMNVCSFNVRLYSCKSPLLTIGSNGVLNSFDLPI